MHSHLKCGDSHLPPLGDAHSRASYKHLVCQPSISWILHMILTGALQETAGHGELIHPYSQVRRPTEVGAQFPRTQHSLA
jgi:hypothetical protein